MAVAPPDSGARARKRPVKIKVEPTTTPLPKAPSEADLLAAVAARPTTPIALMVSDSLEPMLDLHDELDSLSLSDLRRLLVIAKIERDSVVAYCDQIKVEIKIKEEARAIAALEAEQAHNLTMARLADRQQSLIERQYEDHRRREHDADLDQVDLGVIAARAGKA